MKRLASVLLFVGALSGSPVIAADGPACNPTQEAELNRLRDEVRTHSSKNNWNAVEHDYQRQIAVKCGLKPTDHYMGAMAARSVGDIREAYVRAVRSGKQTEIVDMTQFGEIEIAKRSKGKRDLSASENPMDPTQRDAIAFAKKTLEESGSFNGYLPGGKYKAGDDSFEVKNGEKVKVGK